MEVEDSITRIETSLKHAHRYLVNKISKENLQNLSLSQLSTLKLLKENNNLTIKPTDKNLGPAVMDTNTYINKVLTDHLLTKDYRQLSTLDAKNIMDNSKTYLKSLISHHQTSLTKPEFTFFQRNFQKFHRLPMFLGSS